MNRRVVCGSNTSVMHEPRLKQLLELVSRGEVSVCDAVDRLRDLYGKQQTKE